MADDSDLKFTLDLDNKEFIQKLIDSKQLLVSLGEAKNLEGLTEGLLAAGAVVATLGIALFALKEAFDIVFDAEKIRQVNTQFDQLATNAGVSAENIKKGLEEASAGLVSENELLKLANKGFVELGVNAGKMPQIMEAARKVTAVFGGELTQRFEEITQAIANGNQRALKHLGLTVDVNEAYKTYANSIGVTLDALTKQDKQTALLNATLENAKQRFAGVNADITVANNTWAQLKATLSDVKEAITLVFDKYLRPIVLVVLKDISIVAKSIKGLFGPELEKDSKEAHKKSEIQSQEAAQRALQLQKENANKRHELGLKQEVEFQKEKSKIERDVTQESFEGLKFKYLDEATLKKEIEQRNQEEIAEIHKDAENKIEELKAKRMEGKITESQFEILQDDIIGDSNLRAHAKKMELVDFEKQKLAEFYNWQADHAASTNTRVMAGWKASSTQMIDSLQKSSNIGRVAFGSMEKGAKNAFMAIGSGSKSAGEALKGFMFGAIGDIAEAQGEYLLASGLGTSNPLAVAEGGVLLALAGFLKSQAGGSSTGGSGGGGGGGGGAASAASSTPAATSSQISSPQKTLHLEIHGSIFDSPATGTRLMDIMRQVNDSQDYKLVQVGQK